LVEYFGDFALRVPACGVWMVSLHEFDEILCEVGCGEVFVVMVVEPFASFWG
jgi:hypothetical protein